MINERVIESYLYCRYKAYLLLKPEKNPFSAYESLIIEQEYALKREYLIKTNATRINLFEENYLKQNQTYFLEKRAVENSNFSLESMIFEFVQNCKTTFEVVPIFFSYSNSINKKTKLLNSTRCLILAKITGYKIKHFKTLTATRKIQKTSISALSHDSRKIIDELIELSSQKTAPKKYRIKECERCSNKENCLNELVQLDCISLLGKASPKLVNSYNSKGFFTINQLSYAFRPRKGVKRYYLELKALSIRLKKIHIWNLPEIPLARTQIYLDIEYLPAENFIYLVGILIKEKDGKKKGYSFWIDSVSEQQEKFKKVYEIIKQKDSIIFYYGNPEKLLFRQMEGMGFKIPLTFNVLSYISDNIYFPTYTNGLKDLCNSLGFKWESEIDSGPTSIIFRKKWEDEKSGRLKNALLKYNRLDCEALLFLFNKIQNVFTRKIGSVDINSLKKESTYNWRNTDEYFSEDFKFINRLSYFSYNHDKIYFRTHKRRKNDLVKYKKKKLKPNEIVEILPRKCPSCKTQAKKNLSNRLNQSSKLVVDIKFMKNGLKRWIIKYNSGVVKCQKCQHEFSPKNVYHLKSYGINLKKFCINQHISYHVSFSSIAESLRELGIEMSKMRVFESKKEISTLYQGEYHSLKATLLSGNLIQIDETQIKMKGGIKGYIWVFSNMMTVFYLFRQNRKASFLKEFLKGFKGIVISDFYSGYDSLKCSQQKCIVHLLRDLNSDFYKNQLDIELKNIITDFGVLLKSIVATIDRYGLRKRNLNKHRLDVERFYKRRIVKMEYNSSLATKYKNRFEKYKNKLWTFLEHDNVPWHNNNAEYAIKSFAKHREKGNRIFTKDSAETYSILVSLEQTCKYRNIRFMNYLRGKEEL